jgi:drug/metabolite transporter (DMT)-like permease
VGAVFQPSSVVFTAFISSVILRTEAKSWLKFIGLVISIVGALAMVFITSASKSKGDDSEKTFFGIEVSMNSLIGASFFIANCFLFGLGLNIQGIALRRKIPPNTVTLWTFIWGTGLNIPVCFIFYSGTNFVETDTYAWLAVIFAGSIGCALPFLINTVAVNDLSPMVASAYETTVPIFSFIIALIISDSSVNWWCTLAAAVILAGVFLVGYAKYREEKKAKRDIEALSPVEIKEEEQIEDSFLKSETPDTEEELQDVPLSGREEINQSV